MRYLFLFASMLCYTFSFAADEQDEKAVKEFNNEATLSIGSINIPGRTRGWHVLRLPAISYTRKVYKNLHASIGYVQWETYLGKPFRNYTVMEWENYAKPEVGDISTREGYKMVDALLKYQYSFGKGKHVVKAGAGGSYTWGKNTIVDEYILIISSFKHDIVIAHEERVAYFALTTNVAYQFRFLKERLGVGGSFNTRTLPNRDFTQYDISFNASVFL